MRLPSVPGPADLVALVGRVGELAEQLMAAVPRLTAVLGEAEKLVVGVADLLERIEGTRLKAEAVIRRTEATRVRAELVIDGLELPVARLIALLDRLEPSLVALQPTLDRLAESMDPHEVDALVALIDQLPLIAEHMEQDVIPVLGTLGSVAPDLHDLLDTSRELNEMLLKLPGMKRIRRRVDEQQAEEEQASEERGG